MTRTPPYLWVLGIGLLLVPSLWITASAGSPAPRQAAEADQTARINVGTSKARPGEPIDIRLTLSGSGPLPISALAAEITFPKNALSFTKADLGLAGKQSQAGTIQVTVKQAPDDSRLSLIELTMSTKGSLNPGILAYIGFRVSPEARKGVLPLKLKDLKTTSEGGQPFPQLVKGNDGEVTVFDLNEEIPMVGCFFFTH